MKICPSCNHKNPPIVDSCSACGASLDAPAQEDQPQPTAPQLVVQVNTGGESSKSKTTAGVLGILLGPLGIHNFYIGKTATGIVKLSITILSCGWLGIFMWIWAVYESVELLRGKGIDGAGLPIVL